MEVGTQRMIDYYMCTGQKYILHLQIKQLNHFNVYLNKSDDWKKGFK